MSEDLKKDVLNEFEDLLYSWKVLYGAKRISKTTYDIGIKAIESARAAFLKKDEKEAGHEGRK